MQDFRKPYGLIVVSGNEQPIELKDVQITCSVLNLTSNVTTKFTYKNQHSQQVQGSFVFPLEDVAVYDFEAEVDGRKIVAKCRPRAEAKINYDEAIASGHAAFLAEQEEHCEDVFQMSIGNIPPNGTVIIQLKYVGHLECENTDDNGSSKSQAVFTLPSVTNPRYSPAEKEFVESPLIRLVKLQNIAGFWDLVEDLAKCINLSLDSLRKSQPKTWSASYPQAVTSRIWATALVLAYLHSELSASVDEWELVGRKAKAWLIQQASAFEKSPPTAKKLVDGLIQQAKGVVNK